ncbi:MAG: hypothetical protein ACI4MM_00905 [Candidatus Ventricola sp.]
MKGERAACGYAPIKKRVILPALAAVFLLALVVCILHVVNAVSLRGTAKLSEYDQTDGRTERLMPIVETPWVEQDVLHIRGALVRMDQAVGSVNVRAGLIPEMVGAGMTSQDEVILLNTQMVRRFDYAAEYGCDDHCGFSAAVRMKRLPATEASYRVVLVDETDGAKRMIDTELRIVLAQGMMTYEHAGRMGEGKLHAQ